MNPAFYCECDSVWEHRELPLFKIAECPICFKYTITGETELFKQLQAENAELIQQQESHETTTSEGLPE